MPRKPAQTLPAFTPVPRLCDRSNGWKPEVQRAFIEALAETGSVRSACRRVGRSDHGAYQLRRHPEGKEFRKAWDAAADIGVRRIEDAAMDRALHGVEETYHYHGKLVGRRRRFNERLVMFILRNRAAHRFAEGGGARGLSAVDRQMLKRLKKQWRAEWEHERRPRRFEEARESILAKLEAFEQARRADWTPRERELNEALEEEYAKRHAREQQEARERFARDNPGKPWRMHGDPGPADPALLEPPAETDEQE
jgi:hypothetical protein